MRPKRTNTNNNVAPALAAVTLTITPKPRPNRNPPETEATAAPGNEKDVMETYKSQKIIIDRAKLLSLKSDSCSLFSLRTSKLIHSLKKIMPKIAIINSKISTILLKLNLLIPYSNVPIGKLLFNSTFRLID